MQRRRRLADSGYDTDADAADFGRSVDGHPGGYGNARCNRDADGDREPDTRRHPNSDLGGDRKRLADAGCHRIRRDLDRHDLRRRRNGDVPDDCRIHGDGRLRAQ